MARHLTTVKPPPRLELEEATWNHLRGSGLSDDTILLAQITDASNPVTAQLLQSHKVQSGYHIPYFGLDGKRIDHYRIRILDDTASTQKYAQPRNSGNRVYIPPIFESYDWVEDTSIRIFLTEGEKKSLAASQIGIVCLGLGGVYSWRSRMFRFPRSKVRIEDGPKYKQVTFDSEEADAVKDNVVPEFTKIAWNGRSVMLAFDSDIETNPKVQQAAWDLSRYLEAQGAEPRVLYFWK